MTIRTNLGLPGQTVHVAARELRRGNVIVMETVQFLKIRPKNATLNCVLVCLK